jgi:hypothetical protein
MNGYKAFYKGKSIEVYANTSYEVPWFFVRRGETSYPYSHPIKNPITHLNNYIIMVSITLSI